MIPLAKKRRPTFAEVRKYLAGAGLRSLWPLALYRVAGHSMHPTYAPGDTLLGWRWFRPRAGQVVVAVPAGRPLVKRVGRIGPGGRVWLVGDNPAASTDSRDFGAVEQRDLRARIIMKL